jgi:negative regulator of flagellin synthesis FlgM
MKHPVQSSKDVDHRDEAAAFDQVELSSQACDIQRAREAAQDAPDVRMDKVEAARRALQSGNLNLNGQDLAEKLLRDARTESRNA